MLSPSVFFVCSLVVVAFSFQLFKCIRCCNCKSRIAKTPINAYRTKSSKRNGSTRIAFVSVSFPGTFFPTSFCTRIYRLFVNSIVKCTFMPFIIHVTCYLHGNCDCTKTVLMHTSEYKRKCVCDGIGLSERKGRERMGADK